jgi:hypothetical protein
LGGYITATLHFLSKFLFFRKICYFFETMKNYRYLLYIPFLLLGSDAFAQEIERDVVASTGDRQSNGSLIVEWTLGEIMISSVSNSNIAITEGFHQPVKALTGIDDNAEATGAGIRVFPNPTAGKIQFKITHRSKLEQVELYDMSGKQLAVWSQSVGIIDLTTYADGMYGLRFQFEKQGENYTQLIIKE